MFARLCTLTPSLARCATSSLAATTALKMPSQAISRSYAAGTKNYYIGNLPWGANEDDMRDAFSSHGFVERARVIRDKHTGRSKGFGFVEMVVDPGKEIIGSEDIVMMGRQLRINEAIQSHFTPKTPEPTVEAEESAVEAEEPAVKAEESEAKPEE